MHIEKFKAVSVGMVLAHIVRARKPNGEHRNYSNENVDVSKSYLNYHLDNRTCSPFAKLKEILSRDNVKCQKRKDVNTLCSVCLTLPLDVRPEDEREFFQLAYEFLKNRYAPHNNIVLAEVHKDETKTNKPGRPHLHFVFVPLVIDKRKPDRLKVSAKELIDLNDLKSLHRDCSDYIAEHLGYRVSILNDEALKENNSKDLVDTLNSLLCSNVVKNLPIEQYKQARDLIDKLSKILITQREQIKQNENDIYNLMEEYDALVDEYNKLDDEIHHLEETRQKLYEKIHNLEGDEFFVDEDYIRDDDYSL